MKERIRKKAADVKSKLDIFTIEEVLVIIGNVSPVQQSILPLSSEADNAYMRGYEAGKVEGILRANKRPRGKWIRTGSLGNGNAHYECSNCHHGDEYAESQEVPYCWYCGAKMQKGSAE